jgi:hypothetical protein
MTETGQLAPRTRRGDNASSSRASQVSMEPTIYGPGPEPESQAETQPEVTLQAECTVDLHFDFESSPFTPSAPVPRGLFETPMPPYFDSMSDCSSELDLGAILDVDRAKFLETPRPRCPSPRAQKEKAFHADRDSKILRQVNSNFQVLRPGSFEAERAQVEQPPSIKERKPDRSRRHSRRLHRKQGSGGTSKRTRFIEIIYGNERHPS